MPYYNQEVLISTGKVKLKGDLTIPAGADAIIIFSQAGGCSRYSSRSRMVSEYLKRRGLGTLLVDLLTDEEKRDLGRGMDTGLLTARLMAVTQWVIDRDLSDHYRLGYYASSTGTASALLAAASFPDAIGAIVSREGRPDLAEGLLGKVQAPVLLIVGGLDRSVLRLNREAMDSLTCDRELEIIEGATHLFDEAKMEEVASMAEKWFARYLQPAQEILIS